MTTILVSVLLRNNLEWMSILRLMLQTPIADHHSSRDKALDREDGSQFLAVSSRNDAIVIRGVQDVAIDISAETRKLEGKLYAFGNMVTQLAVNQKPASVARVCGIRSSNDHRTSVCPSSQESGLDEHREAYAANTYSRTTTQGVHDVATNISTETRIFGRQARWYCKVDDSASANHKPASIARVCDIRSPNGHHTSVCLLPSNLEWISIPRLMLQTHIGDDHSS
ncbi:hypothetical protein Fmac_015276 [Flemingia macrophylla]|uniref:Uncharacterized protein n=1 Tax=Flemingia macrophylla TaxID=520843 RepID=A0ABD1ME47_9FABA